VANAAKTAKQVIEKHDVFLTPAGPKNWPLERESFTNSDELFSLSSL
jgi:hypothetical protein